MTVGPAASQVAPQRRPGAGLDSTATRARRGLAAGPGRATRTYRLSLVCWVGAGATAPLIERMRRAALAWDPRTRLVSVGDRAQALVVAEDSPEGPSRERVHAAVHSVVEAVRGVRPEIEIHAVIGDRVTSRERLPVEVAQLTRLARHAGAGGGEEVVWSRRHSLAWLLGTLDPRAASAFVEEQLAALRAYDREHGTNLQRVLELALDHENRNDAARAAFMHRNTFRRQLGKALELIDADLACPEGRLAVHVALKMRALFSSPGAPSTPRR
jgi:PucR family transcriptional regulator, purine catabolism regulatory protein